MPMPLEPRRVLAVRLDNIGDVVMTGPALRALKTAWPQAELTLLASPAGGRVAPLLPWVDHVLVQRTLWQDLGRLSFDPAREFAFIERLREGAYDAAVIFTSFSQTPYGAAYASYLAGIPVRVGQARDFGGGLLSTCIAPLDDAAHQVDRNLHVLRALELEACDARMALEVPAHIAARADALLADAGIARYDDFIAIAPGASCDARRYDAKQFAVVARRLAQRAPLPVVVVGNEADRARMATWPPNPRVVSLAGATSVPELAAVIERAALVVTNNSGSMHIADAFGRPQVVLFSGTELESQWAPRSSPLRLYRRDTACAPCHRFTCPHDMECLDISPDAVVDAALDLLAATAPSARRPGLDLTQGERLCGPSVY